MKKFNFLITAHSDNPTRLELLLKCIESIKKFGYKAIVVDHYFNYEAFKLSDGYVWIEDNEIVTRSHKLKKNVIMVNVEDPYLFHLPHHAVEEDKSIHDHYNSNQCEYKKVCQMEYTELQKYIKTWKL